MVPAGRPSGRALARPPRASARSLRFLDRSRGEPRKLVGDGATRGGATRSRPLRRCPRQRGALRGIVAAARTRFARLARGPAFRCRLFPRRDGRSGSASPPRGGRRGNLLPRLRGAGEAIGPGAGDAGDPPARFRLRPHPADGAATARPLLEPSVGTAAGRADGCTRWRPRLRRTPPLRATWLVGPRILIDAGSIERTHRPWHPVPTHSRRDRLRPIAARHRGGRNPRVGLLRRGARTQTDRSAAGLAAEALRLHGAALPRDRTARRKLEIRRDRLPRRRPARRPPPDAIAPRGAPIRRGPRREGRAPRRVRREPLGRVRAAGLGQDDPAPGAIAGSGGAAADPLSPRCHFRDGEGQRPARPRADRPAHRVPAGRRSTAGRRSDSDSIARASPPRRPARARRSRAVTAALRAIAPARRGRVFLARRAVVGARSLRRSGRTPPLRQLPRRAGGAVRGRLPPRGAGHRGNLGSGPVVPAPRGAGRGAERRRGPFALRGAARARRTGLRPHGPRQSHRQIGRLRPRDSGARRRPRPESRRSRNCGFSAPNF